MRPSPLLLIALLGCPASPPALSPAAPKPVASAVPPAPAPAASPTAPVPAPAPALPAATPRSRAAYGMVLYLREYARTLVRMDGSETMSANGCPRGVSWVTWGMAKTDPWDTELELYCQPRPAADPQIGSAGPDARHGTADDLRSDQPFVEAKAACEAACRRVGAREGAEGVKRAVCGSACLEAGHEAQFYVDTCALVDGCDEAIECLDSALAGNAQWASCADFGESAARVAGGAEALAGKLTKERENGVLRVHELVCVDASASARELTLCFLTVQRATVEELLTGTP